MKYVYCVLVKSFELNDNFVFRCSTYVSGVYSTFEGARRCQEILVKGESCEILDDELCEFPEYCVNVSLTEQKRYVIDKVPFDL